MKKENPLVSEIIKILQSNENSSQTISVNKPASFGSSETLEKLIITFDKISSSRKESLKQDLIQGLENCGLNKLADTVREKGVPKIIFYTPNLKVFAQEVLALFADTKEIPEYLNKEENQYIYFSYSELND
jgi:hypothetical protein